MTELIDLDEYKEYKDIKSTTRDGKIQTLISQVSALIENYCNRKFIDYSNSNSPKVEWFDAKTNKVYLTEFPVIAVLSVKTSENGGLDQTELTANATTKDGYYADLENGVVMTQQAVNNFLSSYDVPYRSLEVEYTAGYTVDTLPKDLKLATMDLIAYYEESESKPTKSLLGATIDNPLPSLAQNFPPHIKRILDLYRYSPH